MNVFELFATLGLDTSGYDEGLQGAQSAGESFASSLTNGFSTACRVGAIAVGATATAVAGASVAFVNGVQDVASYGDSIDKTSQRLGISTTAFQEWDYVLNIAGTSMDNMQMGMKTLTNQLDEARNGSESAIANFEALGLSLDDINNMSREEVFQQVIFGFQGMADSTERAALANDIFGRSGQELTPLFNMTEEQTRELIETANEYGMVMSEDAVQASATFTDSMTTMKNTLAGVKNDLLSDFLPSFSTVMDGLSAIFSGDEGGLALVTEGVNEFASQMNETLPMFLEIGGEILGVLGNAIIDNLPTIIETGSVVIGRLGDAIISNLPALVNSAVLIIGRLASGIISALPQLASAGLEIMSSLGQQISQNLPTLMQTASEVIAELAVMLTQPDTLTMLVQTGIDILLAVANGLTMALPQLTAVIPEVVVNLVSTMMDNSPLIIDASLQILGALATAVLASLFSLMGMSSDEVMGGIQYIQNGVTDALNSLLSFIGSVLSEITGITGDDIDELVSFFTDGFDNIYSTVSGILDSVLSVFSDIFDDVRGVVSDAVDFLMGAFDFEWSLPDIKLPHFNITGGEAPYGLGGQGTFPSISIDWYAKAMNQPMILNDPTIFGMGNGRMLGAGEAGAELIVGWNELKKELGGSQGVYEIHVHNYIGGDEIDELVINSNQINDKISGGRG